MGGVGGEQDAVETAVSHEENQSRGREEEVGGGGRRKRGSKRRGRK